MYSYSFFESRKEKKELLSNSEEIIRHLVETIGERNLDHLSSLNKTRDFIKDYFAYNGAEPLEKTYAVDKDEVANIIAEIRGISQPENIIILGSHYDTVAGSPGADDNASGIAALLELHRLLSRYTFKKTIRFVAFSLEEPPHIFTKNMGSLRYAKACKKRKENIELAVIMDMIGCGGKKHKQEYPPLLEHTHYPKKGDYLAVVTFPSYSRQAFIWKKIHNENFQNKIYEFILPASVHGIDFSDHTSFMKNGYPAILLTDTGFYRNIHYHQPGDTFETLDLHFLVKNITAIYVVLKELLNMEKDLGIHTSLL